MGCNIARAQLEINQIDQIASSRLGEEKKKHKLCPAVLVRFCINKKTLLSSPKLILQLKRVEKCKKKKSRYFNTLSCTI